MREQFLLGATKSHELVFGEIELRESNDSSSFSVSFNLSTPFRADDINLTDYISDMLECYDKCALYDLCEEYDCAPSELAFEMANNCWDLTEYIDCSLYPECITANNEDWYFEASSCGQHDSRDEMVEYVNKELYDLIMSLWNNYHLQSTNDEIYAAMTKIREFYNSNDFDEYDWIINYLEKNSEALRR